MALSSFLRGISRGRFLACFLLLLGEFALLLFFAASCCAGTQEERNPAVVTVHVSDALGGAVSNARVHFLERSPRKEKGQITTETGSATVELQPGTFDLTVTSSGFLAFVIRDAEVKPGEHRQINVVLKVKTSDCCIDPTEPTIEPERAKLDDLEESTEQVTTQATKHQGCRYIQSQSSLSGYETGGPYTLDHFRLTKGRTDLREFLWTHWHDHQKGFAEARVRTVDRGTVKVLYVVRPDSKGQWGIDAELDRPMDPPCIAFHADSLVRIPISKPDEDYPSQTIGLWPPDKLPKTRLADSEVKDAKLYRLILVRQNKPTGDAI